MMNEMELDMYNEITFEMYNAYANHSRIARGIAAAKQVMEDMFTILPVSATVKAKVLENYETRYGFFKVR